MSDETGQIICGFAGIGKSTAALSLPGVVDLESTPFERDWERYSKVARHMAANGYTVLLSCHRELREQLTDDGAMADVPTFLSAHPEVTLILGRMRDGYMGRESLTVAQAIELAGGAREPVPHLHEGDRERTGGGDRG